MKDKLEKILNYKNTGKILFMFEFVLSVLSVTFILKNAMTDNSIYKYLFIVDCILLGLVMLLLFVKYYKKIEILFLILVIPLGLGYSTLIIPNQVPDEASHFVRVYTVANGDFFVGANKKKIPIMKVPKNYEKNGVDYVKSYKKLNKVLHTKTNYNNTVNSASNSAASYFFGSYLIPSIGVNIGRLLGLEIYYGFFIARFLNLLFFILTGYLVLKYIPFGKLFMFVYMFTPMMLQQGASVSSDVLLNCSSLLFVTYILYLKFNDKIEKLSIKNILLLGILMIIISCSKIVYFPLIFLVLLLNKKIKNSDKKCKYLLYGLLFVSLLSAVFFYFQTTRYRVHISYFKSHNINSKEQLKWILTHPIGYINVLINNINFRQEFYITSFFGQDLGWFNIFGSYFSVIVLFVLFVISPFLENNKKEFKIFEKICVILLAFIVFNCVLGGMYLSWTNIGSNVIEGVQGRYFIPFIFLIFLSFISIKKKIIFKNTYLIYFLILLFINFNSLCNIFNFF